MEGIHSRTDFDLSQHEKTAGKSMQYVDQQDGNKKYIPYVVETSVGLDRTVLAIMSDAYRLENAGDKENERVVMKFSPSCSGKSRSSSADEKAPLEEKASALFEDLQQTYLTEYDVAGSIGKRYRRQDEIGTPYCVTIDGDSLEDNTVTIRIEIQ